MFEVQVLVPVANNDATVFEVEVTERFESAVLERFGGFSLLPGEVIGEWRSDAGIRYRDQSRCYSIALGSIGQGGDVVALAGVAKMLFSQEAIAIRYLGQFEVL